MTEITTGFNLKKFTRMPREELWGHLFIRRIVGAPYNSETVIIYFDNYFGGRFLALDGKQYNVDGKSICGKYELVAHLSSHGKIYGRPTVSCQGCIKQT